MTGVSPDGKIILVNKDFSIKIPYGAAYELDDGNGDKRAVLTITRFDELPQNYVNGPFDLRSDAGKYDVLSFFISHDLEDGALNQMNFSDFLGELKRSGDERFAWAAVGTAAGTEEEPVDHYRALKVIQDTPELKIGYVTDDLFVSVKFVPFIFVQNHGYKGVLKVERQNQKFKRTELFIKSLLSSVKPNTI